MKILFLSVTESTFVLKDFQTIQKNFPVSFFLFKNNTIGEILRLLSLVKKHDLLFCWFASINFFLPVLFAKILKKKIIIITGGYDVARVPELRYGSCYSGIKKIIVKLMLRFSDKALPVSKSNYNETILNCGMKEEKLKLIYHGFADILYPDFNKKENRIVTVAFVNESSFLRKGIDRFITLAEYLPDIPFHIIGKVTLNNIKVPSNIIFEGYLTDSELIDLYNKCKIYVQFSRHEAFGCSVAEAMQLGCLPVINNVFSLPEVAGNNGMAVNNFDDYLEIAKRTRELLNNYTADRAKKCIEYISDNFPLRNREEKILELLNNI